MPKSLINRVLLKALMFAAIVAVWVYYYNSSYMTQLSLDNAPAIKTEDLSVSKIKQAVSEIGEKIQSNVPDAPETTTVYKWYDSSGKLHVSNTPPANVSDVQVQEYKSNVNIVPSSVKPSAQGSGGNASGSTSNSATSTSGKDSSAAGSTDSNRVDSYRKLLEKAQQARSSMEKRNQEIENTVNQ